MKLKIGSVHNGREIIQEVGTLGKKTYYRIRCTQCGHEQTCPETYILTKHRTERCPGCRQSGYYEKGVTFKEERR